MDIKTKVNEYADLFLQIKARFNDSDAIVILQEMRKDARAAAIQKGYKSDVPATAKQIGYLKKLGAEIPEGLTKKQASEMIENARQ